MYQYSSTGISLVIWRYKLTGYRLSFSIICKLGHDAQNCHRPAVIMLTDWSSAAILSVNVRITIVTDAKQFV